MKNQVIRKSQITVILVMIVIGLSGCQTMRAIGEGLKAADQGFKDAGYGVRRSPAIDPNKRYNDCVRENQYRSRNDSMVSVNNPCY